MAEPVARSEPPHPPALLHEDALNYTPTPRSVPLARHRTARLLTDWGHPTLAGDAALITSELMTNALLHGSHRDRLIHVRIALTSTTLHIEVSDPRGERLPSPRPAEGTDQFGRGLHLVGALVDDWGVCPREGVGKTVYAVWALGATAGPSPVVTEKGRGG
ncbi:ATP-binding protein [Streptomyces sp. NPDC059009]|uniref:ATP-binding protein n=1 Tax=Streptomyces sp. NPDC059009 TaxID=3346694 RepID=UPI0036894013